MSRRAFTRATGLALTPLGAGLVGATGGALAVASVAVLAWGWSSGRLSLSTLGSAEAELMAVDALPEVGEGVVERELVFLPEPAGWRGGEAEPVDARVFGDAEALVQPEPTRPAVAAPEHDGPMFDGRPLKAARTMTMKVTAYSPDERSCGIWADGKTASGYSVWTNGMKLVAADTRLLPFGTIISIPGYNGGKPVQVLDRGGKIKGHRLDVLYPTHEIALKWGVQDLEITVYDYADE
ncbi:MAG: 3D domain-containing protein [Planctomycetota bacterium]